MPISSARRLRGPSPPAAQQQQQQQQQRLQRHLSRWKPPRPPLQDASNRHGSQTSTTPRSAALSSGAHTVASSTTVASSSLESYERIRRKRTAPPPTGPLGAPKSTSGASPMNSLGGQLVVTGAGESLASLAGECSRHANQQASATARQHQAQSKQPDSTPDGPTAAAAGPKSTTFRAVLAACNAAKPAGSAASLGQFANPALGKQQQRASPFANHSSKSVSQLSLSPSATSRQQHQQAGVGGSMFTIGAASSAAGSTAQLQGGRQPASLHINRRVNLKYVKTLVVALLALDLLLTVLVHQFASRDELSLKWLGFVGSTLASYKLRLSLLNLLLSAVWFVCLIGAIIFDVYFVLLIGCLVDIVSFVALLALSVRHFTQQIDYNTVNMTSLLLLLFSIIFLHVYLLAMATLTTYLALAVKQRNKLARR